MPTVHGEAFLVAADLEEVRLLEAAMRRMHVLTLQILGPEKEDQQEVRILNRSPRWRIVGRYGAAAARIDLLLTDWTCDS